MSKTLFEVIQQPEFVLNLGQPNAQISLLSTDTGIPENGMFILELDEDKISRKPQVGVRIHNFFCAFSLKPIHSNLLSLLAKIVKFNIFLAFLMVQSHFPAFSMMNLFDIGRFCHYSPIESP